MTHHPFAALTRSVPVAEVNLDADGTLEALFVPWDTPITVFGDVDEPEPYREGFRRTAFDEQLNRYPETVHEVALRPAHTSTEHFGRTRELRVVEHGLHGVIRVLPSRRADVREMVDEGVDSVSIEFHPLQRGPRISGGVRWRDRAFLTGIVLTSSPAYAEARVLALRSADALAEIEAEREQRFADAFGDLDELRAAGERWNSLQPE